MEIISLKIVHENLIRHLQSAKCDATLLKLDYHFISEIDHLIQTADANREGEGICDHCKHAVWKDGEIFDCRKEPIFDPGVPSDHKCCNGKFEQKEEK